MRKSSLVLMSFFVCLFVLGFSQVVFAQACGNGKCQKNESCLTCPQDCGTCGGNWDDISLIDPGPIDWQEVPALNEDIKKAN